MRKAIFILIAISLVISCKKKEATFCYTCSQKYTYRATASSPAYSTVRDTQYCDKTYEDIVSIENDAPGVETQLYTSYQLECVRQQ